MQKLSSGATRNTFLAFAMQYVGRYNDDNNKKYFICFDKVHNDKKFPNYCFGCSFT